MSKNQTRRPALSPRVSREEWEEVAMTCEEEYDLNRQGLISYNDLSGEVRKVIDRVQHWSCNDHVYEVDRMLYYEFVEFERKFESYKVRFKSLGWTNWFLPAVKSALGQVVDINNLLQLCEQTDRDEWSQGGAFNLHHVQGILNLSDKEIQILVNAASEHKIPNTSVKNLRTLARVWEYEHYMPMRLALRIKLDPTMLIQTGLYVNNSLEEWAVRINERAGISRNRQACIDLFLQCNRVDLAVRKKYGIEGDLLKGMTHWVEQNDNHMPNLKVKALSDAYLENGDNYGYFDGYVRIVAVFGNNWKQWLSKQEKLNRSFHDSSFWLPLEATPDYAQFAMKNADRPIKDMQVIAGVWTSLTPEQKKLSFKDLLLECKSANYLNVSSKEFAWESAQWGVRKEFYSNYEARFLASQALPDFHPEVKVELSGLTGQFLKRSDVRGIYLGHYTNCCQHPDNVGKSCAWFGQEDAHSGFFVVTDKKGEILAQSWTWETEEGVCFDNVEAKGLGDRDNSVGEVYKQAAQQLATNAKLVTIGGGLGDLACISMIGSQTSYTNLSLPKNYSGYTDAGTQYTTAENPHAVGLQEEARVTYVRGLIESDLPACESVATQVYPDGWQFAGSEETDYGLVLVHENQTVGYSCIETSNRYIADIAVLDTARAFSTKLIDSTLAYCHRIGGEWTADCRESTSYRLMKIYARRGRIDLIAEEPNGDLAGETLYKLTFTV